MAGTVRAQVLVKPKTLELREFARPATGPDDALLRIEACGICGSDYPRRDRGDRGPGAPAIHMLAGHVAGMNPIHLALVPGAP